jgi:hypothetical protein
MVTIDSGIVFDFPETWETFTEGSRCVFLTPRGEDIIVSATRVSGSGPEHERQAALDALFHNGLQAAQTAASAPDLRITRPLAEDVGACSLPCWSVVTETTARDAFFAVAVIRHQHGTLFLTYEAPVVGGAEAAFRDILRMVHET